MTTFADDLKTALKKNWPGRVVYAKNWRTRGDNWNTGNGRPVGHMHHHTAGAATQSRDPKDPGNKKGANAGVVKWCINPKASHGWCNAVIDRDGTIYIVGAKAQWHAGLGSFAGTRWEKLGIPANAANTRLFGTEVVSKGLKRDFTKAQLQAIDALNVSLREATGWKGFKLRCMNHKDWTTRKNDTLYPWTKWVRRARLAWLTRTR